MAQKILILGITGVDKKVAIANLLDYFKKRRPKEDFPITVDFENDYLKKRVPLHDFLSEKEHIQWMYWKEAWQKFIEDYPNPEKDIILTLHGVIASRMYGFRIPINYGCLQEWKPTKVVTLIDDVYLNWFRTEKRARELDWRGRPTIEQLLMARRAETAVGDSIVRYCGPDKYARNPMVAVRHPARVLYRLLYGPEDLKPIYLSFPISGPRELEAKGSRAGIDEVNGFMRRAAQFEKENPGACCFCPLTIDELPLQRLLGDFKESEADPKREPIKMNVHELLSRRWNVRDFWGEETLLCDDEYFQDAVFEDIVLKPEKIEDVLGLIRTDVGYRDFRLVIQSQRLAIFNPRFRDGEEISRGVEAEWECAKQHAIPCHVYQDEKYDKEHLTKARIEGREGALGHNPRQEFGKVHPDLETLFNRLPE